MPEEILSLRTPYQFAKYFFTDNFLDHIVEQTILYSVQQRPEKPVYTDRAEIESFFSTLIWMSMMNLPRSRLYWNLKFRFTQIAEQLSVNRWEEIKRFIHFNNNNNMPPKDDHSYDKLYKLRPLLDHFRSRSLTIPKKNISH
ncbi:hypothetical protein NQ314_018869 [Rhamnusium bicolor]|uniref:PiggyBac transposable element-derived protein domain-containing protein n=1 Tax=Rhamnusium bicolor TaxID=1586634 RepID=A0AAV8WQZ9_9CUCU|nr:hypothetical protein NQ314_018869 [Rhamnusium bicolor]